MCSGNDSGNSCHAENFVVRHGLYRQNISTLEIHHHLMLMFENIVLRLHHLGRGCREFKSGLAFIMKITPFSLADEEHANTAQLVELVLENQFDIYPLHWSDVCKLYPELSMHKYDTAEHVHGGYQDT